MLSSRAIALQGVGFGPRSRAFLGFTNVTETEPIPDVEVMVGSGDNSSFKKRRTGKSNLFTLIAIALEIIDQ
jgi:hypothetical protein